MKKNLYTVFITLSLVVIASVLGYHCLFMKEGDMSNNKVRSISNPDQSIKNDGLTINPATEDNAIVAKADNLQINDTRNDATENNVFISFREGYQNNRQEEADAVISILKEKYVGVCSKEEVIKWLGSDYIKKSSSEVIRDSQRTECLSYLANYNLFGRSEIYGQLDGIMYFVKQKGDGIGVEKTHLHLLFCKNILIFAFSRSETLF